MDSLIRKIRETNLFSVREKADLEASVNRLTADQKTRLEAVIDGYETERRGLMAKFKEESLRDLSNLELNASGPDSDNVKTAAGLIRSGLDAISPDTDQTES